ncbi:GIY-YIG nuclease family protein [Leekyejoonella antrihumi]|uniref:GIY-YIG nuclease family protein n=1 Tax=Leekyejoonella antrihumi TaxID=1660198 RepID=A0A563DWN3_9MICO|nr:GIY-YIG nuclease family protein [Leekyejoonella antrihumi]TWP34539.1 GIY-YIG nuclease family protein [Leekyejoonella antrihumi]
MAWTYMLECCDGSYYVGSTTDLDRRMEEHASGFGAKYTSTRLPVTLVWCHESAKIDQSYALEKQVQGWSRAKRQALIHGRIDLLHGLSRKGYRKPRSSG